MSTKAITVTNNIIMIINLVLSLLSLIGFTVMSLLIKFILGIDTSKYNPSSGFLDVSILVENIVTFVLIYLACLVINIIFSFLSIYLGFSGLKLVSKADKIKIITARVLSIMLYMMPVALNVAIIVYDIINKHFDNIIMQSTNFIIPIILTVLAFNNIIKIIKKRCT